MGLGQGLGMRAAGLLAAAAIGHAARAAPWPNSYLGRVEAQAVIETLNGELLASPSATTTLEAWCADHHMAAPPVITAERVVGADKPITADQRRDLQVGPDEPIGYRHVRLACGDHVLSEADNWYVPSRLTPDMNQALAASDIPFGRVVRPLDPTRQTLAVERLWSPLPPDWDRTRPAPARGHGHALAIPADLFRHRALLLDAQHRPIAEVVETYTGEVLDYPRPSLSSHGSN